jgi:hypothetical protein
MPTEDGNRRRFLGQLAASAAVLGAVPYARAGAATESMVSLDPREAESVASIAHAATHNDVPDPTWDLSWTERLTGEHRHVFDGPQLSDGMVLHHARLFYVQFGEVYKLTDADLRAVIVIRHHAIPMAVGDAVWERYDFIGKKMTKLKDPTTGEWARRNPFLNAKQGDKYSLVWPDGGLDALIKRGAIVLACNMAFGRLIGQIAKQTKQQDEAVRAELTANLVPGVTLVPSGIFGVIRAEEGGCHYIRATGEG